LRSVGGVTDDGRKGKSWKRAVGRQTAKDSDNINNNDDEEEGGVRRVAVGR